MTTWGDRQIYKIDMIDQKQTPMTNKFMNNGNETSLAEYFLSKYNIKLKHMN